MINTILSNSTSELEVKKSKFIANIIKIIDEQDAKEKLDKIRKKYSDARHNCYAYIVYDNESKTKIEKSSDDREPSGTAGIPILIELKYGELLEYYIEYDEFEYFKYICEKNNIEIINTEYSSNVKANIKIKEEDKTLFSTYKCRIIERNVIL